MSRLPTPSGDADAWGTILNDYLSVSIASDGVLKQHSLIVGAEQTAHKGQANGYPALDSLGGLNVVNRVMRVGPAARGYVDSLYLGGINSAYVIADKNNSASDASLLLTDQGNIRAEVGLAGDNDIHFKTVTGGSGGEVFTDRLLIQASGLSNFFGKLGIGTSPTEQLHVAATTGAGRTLVKIENSNAGAGSVGTGIQLKGTANDWSIGTDAGLNGGNNLFIQDNNAGYPPRVLIDTSGNIAVGKDNATYKLDVNGDIASSLAGKGFRVKEGANAKMGTATLVGGSIVVATTAVASTSRIFLTTQVPGGSVGMPYISTRISGTSFTITSTSGTDTSTVAWIIVDPA